LRPQAQRKFNHFSRRHVRREKYFSACKRVSAANALQQAASLLKWKPGAAASI
jgi:hypothetical protein